MVLLGVLSAGEDERGVGAVREVLFGEVEARRGGRDWWVVGIGGLRGGVSLAGCRGIAGRGIGLSLRKVEDRGKDGCGSSISHGAGREIRVGCGPLDAGGLGGIGDSEAVRHAEESVDGHVDRSVGILLEGLSPSLQYTLWVGGSGSAGVLHDGAVGDRIDAHGLR